MIGFIQIVPIYIWLQVKIAKLFFAASQVDIIVILSSVTASGVNR